MPDVHYFTHLLKQLESRSIQATVSTLGIRHPSLREHLFNVLADSHHKTSVLAEPVFEALFPWEPGDKKLEALRDEFSLRTSLIDAMETKNKYRFSKDWYPYKHQVEAWKELMGTTPRSIVVTSGTGSGKTECFMLPILNDLVKEYETKKKPLTGIRALFIYPLNALINSQRERLRAWTHTYEKNIRFCLYNGNTKEDKHNEQKENPNEVLTRKLLRKEPPPLLMTNPTMLEYMLVRQQDNPIIKESKGKLRWIVLDEAHTYLGSQAAELSLLLRRVLHSFAVEANEVRFIATSATISDRLEDQKKLQGYLAKLAGIKLDRVSIIGGKRKIPSLPSAYTSKTFEDIENIDTDKKNSTKRYHALQTTAISRQLHQKFSEKPKKLSALAKEIGQPKESLLNWIDMASYTSDDKGNAFLPLRMHVFHQVIVGLWCCADPLCTEKASTPLNDWCFGYVYTQRKQKCQCGSPVYELVFCLECGKPHLSAIEAEGKLIQSEQKIIDEFTLSDEVDMPEEELETTDNATECDKIFIVSCDGDYKEKINKQDLTLGSDAPDALSLWLRKTISCVACNYTGRGSRSPFRSCFLGAPFYMSTTLPTLLEYCQDHQKNPNDLPSRGRRLISFSDSRQGTAKISIKIQQDAERAMIRSLVYEAIVKTQRLSQRNKEDEETIKTCDVNIEKCKDNKELVELLKKKKIQSKKNTMKSNPLHGNV